MAHTDNGILLDTENIMSYQAIKRHKRTTRSNEERWQCMIPTIWHYRKGKIMDSKKNKCLLNLHVKDKIGRVQWKTIILQWWWIHIIIHLSKPIIYIMMSEPNVTYGFGVVIICWCRLIHCNNCTTLVRDVNEGNYEAAEGI